MRVAKVVPVDEVSPQTTSSSISCVDEDNDLQHEVGEDIRKQMDSDGIPSAVWSRNLAQAVPPKSVHCFARPPVFSMETIQVLPLAARLGAYVAREKAQYRDPFFDLSGIDLRPPDPGPYAGVPLGGLGSGSINRGFRGDFRRWNVLPGRYMHKAYHACQFSLRVKHGGETASMMERPQACVLVDGSEALAASRTSKDIAGLRHWNWTMKPECATYHALYPRAWTVYEEPLPGVRLVCRQISPVLGSSSDDLSAEERQGEYAESSLPCVVFEWRVENLRDVAAEVSLMLSWEADAGVADNHVYVPRCNVRFDRCCSRVSGVEMRGRVQSRKVYSPREEKGNTVIDFMQDLVSKAPDMQYEDPFSYALACLTHDDPNEVDNTCTGITRCPFFSTDSKEVHGNLTARDVWSSFLHEGCLPDAPTYPCAPSSKGCFKSSCCGSSVPDDAGCGALCQHLGIPAHGSRTFTFALSWDVPSVRFGSGKCMTRWYTRFCGTEGNAAPSIAAWAINRYQAWEERIAAWQNPILRSLEVPDFYKHLLFNELYYVSDGGSLWCDNSVHGSCTILPGSGCLQNFGKSDRDDSLKVVDLASRESFSTSDSTQWPSQASQIPFVEAAMLGIVEANAAARASGGDSRMVGTFLYMEGHEYLMYNTYDVHFYASWALAMNWPQLQLSLQKDVITAIACEDRSSRMSIAGRTLHHRKEVGVVPHDVGSPSEEPLAKINTYNLQDVSKWKDLGPKFVLQVYRDFDITKDVTYLRNAWPTMLDVIGAMEKYDRDSDGLIENDGFPDQTFDIWTVTGASAYTGGLWVASLSAMAAIAEALLASTKREVIDEDKKLELPFQQVPSNSAVSEGSNNRNHFEYAFLKKESFRFKDWWRRARKAYVEKLWNGTNGYFDYDNSGSELSDSCMADQCAGQWWARACGLPPVCDEDASCAKASSALLSILELNVYRFGEICAQAHGRSESVQDSKGVDRHCFLAGAVNGMRPKRKVVRDGAFVDGQVDNTCVQSREVWTGVSYGLAAAMLLESKYTRNPETSELLRRGAFDVAKGVYNGGWKEFGYWFATPEAWEVSGNVRAMGYMRPLSIWAMQWALNECKRECHHGGM